MTESMVGLLERTAIVVAERQEQTNSVLRHKLGKLLFSVVDSLSLSLVALQTA